jgi:hypothetical protein
LTTYSVVVLRGGVTHARIALRSTKPASALFYYLYTYSFGNRIPIVFILLIFQHRTHSIPSSMSSILVTPRLASRAQRTKTRTQPQASITNTFDSCLSEHHTLTLAHNDTQPNMDLPLAYDHYSYTTKHPTTSHSTTMSPTAAAAASAPFITITEIVTFLVLVGSAYNTVGGTDDAECLWTIQIESQQTHDQAYQLMWPRKEDGVHSRTFIYIDIHSSIYYPCTSRYAPSCPFLRHRHLMQQSHARRELPRGGQDHSS